jgi:hypothetical protein
MAREVADDANKRTRLWPFVWNYKNRPFVLEIPELPKPRELLARTTGTSGTTRTGHLSGKWPESP